MLQRHVLFLAPHLFERPGLPFEHESDLLLVLLRHRREDERDGREPLLLPQPHGEVHLDEANQSPATNRCRDISEDEDGEQ